MTPYTYKVVSYRVIDGDTIAATVDLGFHTTHNTSFRLARVNAPEKSTPEGEEARLALYKKLFGAKLTLKSVKTEKYGRWLCELFVGDENVNDWLVEKGLAKPYYGKGAA